MNALRNIPALLLLVTLSNCATHKLDPNTVDVTRFIRSLDRAGVKVVNVVDQEQKIRSQIRQKEAADSAIAAMQDEAGIRQLSSGSTQEGNGVSFIAFKSIEQRDRWIKINPNAQAASNGPFFLPVIRCGTLVVVFTPRVETPNHFKQRDDMRTVLESLLDCPVEPS